MDRRSEIRPAYELTGTAGYHTFAVDAREVLGALGGELRAQLPAGPVAWTITSPWGLVHEGRVNLNGTLDRVDDVIAAHLDEVAGNLDNEAAHHRGDHPSPPSAPAPAS